MDVTFDLLHPPLLQSALPATPLRGTSLTAGFIALAILFEDDVFFCSGVLVVLFFADVFQMPRVAGRLVDLVTSRSPASFSCLGVSVEQLSRHFEGELVEQEVTLGDRTLHSAYRLEPSSVFLPRLVVLDQVFLEFVQLFQFSFISVNESVFELKFRVIC